VQSRFTSFVAGLGVLAFAGIVLSGCQHSHSGRVVVADTVEPPVARTVAGPRTGPPDHAPAHGWRRKHGIQHPTQRHKRPHTERGSRVELAWDADLGVHVVVGHAGVYFHADRYLRMGVSGWEWSARVAGSWSPAPDHGVPTGLRDLAADGARVTERKRPGHAPPARRAP
jgi:hypothetical protein